MIVQNGRDARGCVATIATLTRAQPDSGDKRQFSYRADDQDLGA